MAFAQAKAYLDSCGLGDRVTEFAVSSATVKEAAEAVGSSEGEIAKTLSFLVGEEAVLILAAGDCKIDNSKYKAEFKAKAKMIPFEEVEERIGHAVGGVCPFGIREGIKVYLDQSLKEYEIVYPACGSANSAVKLTIPELEMASRSLKWVDVCKK